MHPLMLEKEFLIHVLELGIKFHFGITIITKIVNDVVIAV